MVRTTPRLRRIKGMLIRVPRRMVREERKRMSRPIHHLKAQPKSAGFSEVMEWTYAEHPPKGGKLYQNPQADYFIQSHRDHPHLVLRDETSKPRFVLEYEFVKPSRTIYINCIQRERTRYVRHEDGWMWSPEHETAASKELQKKLGVHPSEFLLDEFIHRHQVYIRQGFRVILDVPMGSERQYDILVKRYFQPDPAQRDPRIHTDAPPFYRYFLSLRKKRVKQLALLE